MNNVTHLILRKLFWWKFLFKGICYTISKGLFSLWLILAILDFWKFGTVPDFESFSFASVNFSIVRNKVFNIGVQDYECWPSWHTRFLFEMNFKSSVHSSVPCLPIVDSDWTSSKFFNLEVMKKCIFIFEPLFGIKNDSCNSIRHAWKW